MTKREEMESWNQYGLFCRTYSPGDGVTRYRFFDQRDTSYFGPANGMYTALGWKEAVTYATGFIRAK